ncbi:MAG: hypothetical protein WBG43_07155 [Marinifilaceae bacterium]
MSSNGKRYIELGINHFSSFTDEIEKKCNEIATKDAFSQKGNLESIYLEFSVILNSHISLVLNSFHMSVLSGEYVPYGLYVKKLLDNECKELINKLKSVSCVAEIIPKISDFINKNIIDPIDLLVQYYGYFLQEIDEKINGISAECLFKVLPDSIKVTDELLAKSSYKSASKEVVKFIHHNLRLAILDYNISIDDSKLKELLLIHHTLSSESTSSFISDALKVKAALLIKKILLRENSDSQKYFMINNEIYNIKDSDFNIDSLGDFYDRTLVNSYSFSDFDNDKNSINLIFNKRKRCEKLSFEEYHLFIKYLRTLSKPNIEFVEKIWKEFIEEYRYFEKSEFIFDSKAYAISRHYLYNNLFSYFLSSSRNLSISDIDARLTKIEWYQEKENIFNYYPYQKLCFYLRDRIENEINLSNDAGANEFLQYMKKTLVTFERCYKWCVDNDYIPFQPNYDACLTSYNSDDKKFPVFIASSFILPVNYIKVAESLKDLRENVFNFKSRVESLRAMNKDRAELEEIKNNVKNTDKKHIEILSVFAAIVIFASTMATSYTKGIVFKEALQYMLISGYVMSIFVLLIWIISRDVFGKGKQIPRTHIFLISILTIATIFALYIVFY